MASTKNAVFEEDQRDICHTLTKVVDQERVKFLSLAQAFYDQSCRADEKCLQLIEKIIETIEAVLASGRWDDSLFLRNTAKPLHRLKEDAMQMRHELMRGQGLEEITEYKLQANEIKLYVSLYQADGHDLNKWAAQLCSIASYMLGRPVYRNEADIQRLIRQKLLQTSESYAVIVVDQRKILPNDFGQSKKDRHGYELVTLQVGSVGVNNIIEFVHLNKRYHFYQQRLIAKSQHSLWRGAE